MMMIFIAGLAFAIWIYLIFARGHFWRTAERHDRDVPPLPAAWPSVAAIIPARNEEETIAETVTSLLAQDYRGRFALILVDDGSSDGTVARARETAVALGAPDRLTVVTGTAPPAGWTGKVWAQQQGFERAVAMEARPDYLLLTDADITEAPSALAALVSRAVAGRHVLTSVMARLRCKSFAERFAIPAFVYFFRMLYPFAWVARSDRRTVAAAGGCMLVRTDALASIGAFRTMSAALIDDCTLARRLAPTGTIWLGLSDDVRSIRAYESFGPIRKMVVRSAYTELKHSPLRLAVAMLGMALIFLVPPIMMVFAGGYAAVPGIAAYALMVFSLQPTLHFYRLTPLWGLLLPAIALLYMVWTFQSAVQHVRGRGGSWKGRFQADAGGAR
jgi:hopene-associated glycosyltransferase HpnB